MRTTMRWMAVAAAILVCLAPVRAEEREPDLRRRALKLNDVTGKEPIRAEVAALLKDRDGTKKLVAHAARMAADTPQPFTYNATLILATVSSQLKDYRSAETFYRLHLKQAEQLRSVKGLMSAYGGLIPTLYAQKKYAEAEKACKEVTENPVVLLTLRELEADRDKAADEERKSIKRFMSAVLEELIVTVAQQGDADRAVEIVDKLLEKQSDGWLALDLKARVYRITGKTAEAIKAYEDELQRIKDDKDLSKENRESLLDDVRYSLSGVYIDGGKVDKAVEQLQTLLAKDPDNATYNNDLGYVWADHDMKLDEAEKLVRKAIELDRKQRRKANPDLKPEDEKDNAAYLDSLGWVLYKQKKYEEARKCLQKAVEQEDGKHIEILDHLGDVLLALGQKAEAVATWKKGVAAAEDSKREQKRKREVEKKIKAHE